MARRYLDVITHVKNDKYDDELASSYNELLTMQRSDGSFDLWKTDHSSDVFKSLRYPVVDYLDLTIFVIKLLVHYEAVIPLPNKTAIQTAMGFLISQQKTDGSFQSKGSAQFKDLQKYSNISGVSLTAHALIGILESKYLKTNYGEIVNKGLKFIESKFSEILESGTNYERAITFYLYVLAGNKHQPLFKKLIECAIRRFDEIFWNQSPLTTDVHVQIASYVALSLTKLQRYKLPLDIWNSLNKYFRDIKRTPVTVVCLQALTEILQSLHSNKTIVKFFLKNQNDEDIFITSSQVKNVLKRIPSKTRKISISAFGKGVSKLQISCRYQQRVRVDQQRFSISANASRNGNILNFEVCVKTTSNQYSGKAVLDINLPSGYFHFSGPNGNFNEIRVI